MIRVLYFILFLFLTSCGIDKVRLAAAANLSPVLPELIQAFREEHPDIVVEYSLGSSGKLSAQILQGADFDIFLSADENRPAELYSQGLGREEPRVYALGLLVYLSPKLIPASSLGQILRESDLKNISLANPVTAPYGRAALQVLDKLQLLGLTNRAVYAQNVGQAVQYVLTTGISGFVPLCAIQTPEVSNLLMKGGAYLRVAPDLYDPIRQSALLLKNTGRDARIFYEFLFSDRAVNILSQAGYSHE